MSKSGCVGSAKSLLVCVCILEKNEVIRFAADELKKYFHAITAYSTEVYEKKEYVFLQDTLWLGTFKSFPFINFNITEESSFADGIYIDTDGPTGIICGLNPRCVILAVYKYLTELGCRWIRPGNDGELLPDINNITKKVMLVEKPSYKYRGICVEGAVSFENIINIIDWMPKVGFNSYFLMSGEDYFIRWYNHIDNPLIDKKEEFSVEAARDYVRIIENEIRKRGLLYKTVVNECKYEPFGAYIKELQKFFKDERVNFSNYYLWSHNYDPGFIHIGEIIYEDISNHREFGFDGYTSCQVQRAFFPNGFGMTVMGRMLWNSTLTFEEITYDYFKSTYGDEWYECLKYLQKLSELFIELDLENMGKVSLKYKTEICDEVIKQLYQFRPVIEKNISKIKICQSLSWEYLYIHSQIWMEMTLALMALYRNETQKAQIYWKNLKYKLWGNEKQYQEVLDVFNFVKTFDDIIKLNDWSDSI